MLEEVEPVDEYNERYAAAIREGEVAYEAYQADGPMPSNPFSGDLTAAWAEGFIFRRWESEGRPKLSRDDENAAFAAGVAACKQEIETGVEVAIPYDRNSLTDVFAREKSSFWQTAFYDTMAGHKGDGFEVLGCPRQTVDVE